jgi:hypothetical protein
MPEISVDGDQAVRYVTNRGAPHTPCIFSLSTADTVFEPSENRYVFSQSGLDRCVSSQMHEF